MEILKPGEDVTKRHYVGHSSPHMSASGPNSSTGPTKAFHFGLLDVPLSEDFPTANHTGTDV